MEAIHDTLEGIVADHEARLEAINDVLKNAEEERDKKAQALQTEVRQIKTLLRYSKKSLANKLPQNLNETY
jgi:hypothetical protein